MIRINLLGAAKPAAQAAGPAEAIASGAIIIPGALLVVLALITGFVYWYLSSRIAMLQKNLADQQREQARLAGIMEQNKVAYYEIFDNYLVFYWMGFNNGETKTISLDLKADVTGKYKAKASTAYLYYTPEYKNWTEGNEIDIKP